MYRVVISFILHGPTSFQPPGQFHLQKSRNREREKYRAHRCRAWLYSGREVNSSALIKAGISEGKVVGTHKDNIALTKGRRAQYARSGRAMSPGRKGPYVAVKSSSTPPVVANRVLPTPGWLTDRPGLLSTALDVILVRERISVDGAVAITRLRYRERTQPTFLPLRPCL